MYLLSTAKQGKRDDEEEEEEEEEEDEEGRVKVQSRTTGILAHKGRRRAGTETYVARVRGR